MKKKTAPPEGGKANDNTARRLARLAAVQGLYQIALTQFTPAQIIKDFHNHITSLPIEKSTQDMFLEMDNELFGEVVAGVTEHISELDGMISGALDAKFSADRVEILLRAILRAGAYELWRHAKTPAGVVINDYVDVAHVYFDAKEPGLVNGILDKLAKSLRT